MTKNILTLLVMLMIIPMAQAKGKSNFSIENPLPVTITKNLKLNIINKFSDFNKTDNTAISEIVEKAGKKVSGIVSWYADKFHGKKTSSGELYNKNNLTAAHKTLPFGTKVKVTNTNNGKSVVVKINDRGPHTKSRLLDLSKAAFTSIGSINSGTLNVEMEVVE
ncbi:MULTISPECIES: septal ring lytic transglycosylase RlpA family protein [unclassified Empedobacter]|uniref:septal ring lytic transglycosylase RlpA family protein n=1 Tax=unclassified Empedobacter TaxID=2643773 RepID=UPI00244C6E49|nr:MULTISPECIES: septal ring lytic transglycosylase RlpA family protein [unclassified Empedobacter]MDH0659300.1 septal ring lytic transglycosylase RlpA family protein [Empedobacter sp. GD03865]MDH0674558.1 septal ring lytic transglycosylase RlpA family protein [Empedobacter sp. GD03861]